MKPWCCDRCKAYHQTIMKKTHLNIDPTLNNWKQRLTVIWSTLIGKTYHMTVSEKTIKEMLERVQGVPPAGN